MGKENVAVPEKCPQGNIKDSEILKVACNLLKVHILSQFKGDAPFTVLAWRFFEEC